MGFLVKSSRFHHSLGRRFRNILRSLRACSASIRDYMGDEESGSLSSQIPQSYYRSGAGLMSKHSTAIRNWLNIVGGGAILVSLTLPWHVSFGNSRSIIDSLKGDILIALFVTSLIGLAGLVCLLTRFGGLLALGGVILYSLALPVIFIHSIPTGSPPPSGAAQYALGFWMALLGAGLSLGGESRNYQFILAHLPKVPK